MKARNRWCNAKSIIPEGTAEVGLNSCVNTVKDTWFTPSLDLTNNEVLQFIL